MSYHDRCKLLNSNLALIARQFQYRVEIIVKKIIVDDPLGKVIYHAIRVEFQVFGLPRIHCFLWVLNATTLSSDSKVEYISLADKI